MIETNDLRKFSVNEWYPIFKDVAIETLIFDIYPTLLSKFYEQICIVTDVEQVCPVEYVEQLKDALSQFNNEVFVKSNWHAPLDAKFLCIGNILKITNLEEMLLCLISSTIIMNDFEYKDVKFCFALRPWLNIHPATEFRCIVINDILRGITPRDWLTYYPHFEEEGPELIRRIAEFYEENIKSKFSLKNYTFDIIVPPHDNVLLVDFGPLNSKSNLYAFKWKEVQPIVIKNSKEAIAPVFRYVEENVGIVAPSLWRDFHTS